MSLYPKKALFLFSGVLLLLVCLQGEVRRPFCVCKSPWCHHHHPKSPPSSYPSSPPTPTTTTTHPKPPKHPPPQTVYRVKYSVPWCQHHRPTHTATHLSGTTTTTITTTGLDPLTKKCCWGSGVMRCNLTPP